jgi:glycine dehydrogenase subunit 1
MLRAVGVSSYDDLYADVPAGMKLAEGALRLPDGLSESEVLDRMQAMAGKNKVFSSIFRGAGSYHHYIPSIVKRVPAKEPFLTAYTPYQAEISQGILQSIFEYQTDLCELTGMDVSNASVYDGAAAAAESIPMCRERGRTRAFVSASAHPQVIEVMRTYCFGSGTELTVVPEKDGRTDLDALRSLLGGDAACFYLQQPNYYGLIEDAAAAGEIVHAAGAKFVMGVNPIACALLPTPGECGADVAVGEGQPLGLDLSFGGPYLGFMTATRDMMRKLPGRIVGETATPTATAGLRPDAAPPGNSTSAGKRPVLQHLLQRGALRPDSLRLSCPPWVAEGMRNVARQLLGQGALSGQGHLRNSGL